MQISCKGKCRNEDEREKRGKLATRLPATKHICISEYFSCQALCDSVSSKKFSGAQWMMSRESGASRVGNTN